MEYSTARKKYDKLNWREKLVISSSPWIADDIEYFASTATTETINRFGHNGHNDASDSFRHCYFSALLSANIGYSLARSFLEAHELWNGNPEDEFIMDMYNNYVGLKIGMFGGDEITLSGLCMAAYSDGKLKVIVK
ncbi:hypothetical protein FT643_22845 [Ketobacter sp. MCCC 1A13808]|uniref:DUF6973 domain-containing protein n=1 Tax=Ketobacter sp. MCCC 1A13808 TaxID=2602738 RepID=UPI000F1BFED3|nr:hypothetical protein [Ketobacter sp. MCCC 1A13808]MVF14967.1 hypothetical protein [Ketobacter sp. MCCC 1A13808]RLP53797.1 MAG: hypothetical protein D6160_14510 [Ketobacter sp.]